MKIFIYFYLTKWLNFLKNILKNDNIKMILLRIVIYKLI